MEYCPNFYEIFVFFFTFSSCFFIHFGICPILPLIIPPYEKYLYKRVKKEKKFEWNNRIVCVIHSIVLMFFSFRNFFGYSELWRDKSVTFQSKEVHYMVIGSMAYFSYDFALILSDRVNYVKNLEYIIHHSLALMIWGYIICTRKLHWAACILGMNEVPVPPIHLLHFLRMSNLQHTLLYKVNGLVIALTWFLFRILLGTAYMYKVCVFEKIDEYFELVGVRVFIFWIFILSIQSVMNLYWMWRIFIGLLKLVVGKKSSEVKNE